MGVPAVTDGLLIPLAFVIALYWVTRVDHEPGKKPDFREIWFRFPKFVVGFIVASVLFSFVVLPLSGGDSNLVESTYIKPVTKVLRGWFFCMDLTGGTSDVDQGSPGTASRQHATLAAY